MKIVYSRSKVRGTSGRKDIRVLNPAFFLHPEPDAVQVYLDGPFDAIRAAYSRAGVPVFDMRDRSPLAEPLPPPRARQRRKKAM